MNRTVLKCVEQPLEGLWEANQSDRRMGILGLAEIPKEQDEEDAAGKFFQ